jgi:hypothetical protein
VKHYVNGRREVGKGGGVDRPSDVGALGMHGPRPDADLAYGPYLVLVLHGTERFVHWLVCAAQTFFRATISQLQRGVTKLSTMASMGNSVGEGTHR